MLQRGIYKSMTHKEPNGMSSSAPNYHNKLSPTLLTALKSGQTIGCDLEARHPEHKAWIEVIATFDPKKAKTGRFSPDRRVTVVRFDDSDPVNGYIVRYYEVALGDLQYIWDYDDVATTYEEISTPSEANMEEAVRRFVSDFSAIYVFPDLVDAMLPTSNA